MSFQSNVDFPDIFVLDRVIGEVPLDVYTVNIADILTQSELSDPNLQKEYFLEKVDINAKFIESNISSDIIDDVFKQLDAKGRQTDIRGFVQILLNEKINKETIVSFLRNLGLPDTIITRVFIYLT